MLGIAYSWVIGVEEASDSQAISWAYADNWAWKACSPHLHEPIFLVTEQTVCAFGLQINFAKTWFWASDDITATQTNQTLELWEPQHGIERKTHARDLGLEMHYSGPHRLGHRKDRFQVGHDRLRRLQLLPAELHIKKHFPYSSVWPATFHGCEIHPPATDTLATFRSEAANALVGYSHAMNPAIVLLLGDKRILDPAFYCLIASIRLARAWLLTQTPSGQVAFFSMCIQACGAFGQRAGFCSQGLLFSHKLDHYCTGTDTCHTLLVVSPARR